MANQFSTYLQTFDSSHPRCPHCGHEFSPDDLRGGKIPRHEQEGRNRSCSGEGERPA